MSILRSVLIALAVLFASHVAAEPIDVNTADAQMLIELNGIGPSKADAIIAYRNENGPFRSVDELANVSGIGERMVETLRDQVTVGSSAPSTAAR